MPQVLAPLKSASPLILTRHNQIPIAGTVLPPSEFDWRSFYLTLCGGILPLSAYGSHDELQQSATSWHSGA